MKTTSLLFAFGLLGATALVPAAMAQATPPAGGPAPGASTAAPTPPPPPPPESGARPPRPERADRPDDRGGRADRWADRRGDDESWHSSSNRSDWDDNDDEDGDDWGRGRDDMRGSDRGSDRGARGERWHSREAGRGGEMSPAMRQMHQRLLNHGRGAHLRLKRGDASIDIKCPAGEPIGPCLDSVGKLMDKLHAMPQTP